eukprot:scaffold5834_cov107-Isochrysis_galbana.AAC.6
MGCCCGNRSIEAAVAVTAIQSAVGKIKSCSRSARRAALLTCCAARSSSRRPPVCSRRRRPLLGSPAPSAFARADCCSVSAWRLAYRGGGVQWIPERARPETLHQTTDTRDRDERSRRRRRPHGTLCVHLCRRQDPPIGHGVDPASRVFTKRKGLTAARAGRGHATKRGDRVMCMCVHVCSSGEVMTAPPRPPGP